MKIILGSSSPRRNEILSYFSLPFQQIDPLFDEEKVDFHGDPYHHVQVLSDGKAESLSRLHRESLIISADTIVYREGKIYGKPLNDEEAIYSLTELSGNWHSVISGITIKTKDRLIHESEETRVLFNQLSSLQIKQYQKVVHWADKAGGYAIQHAGGIIVNRIEGCFYNVMGLPINTLHRCLLQFEIDLWDYLQ